MNPLDQLALEMRELAAETDLALDAQKQELATRFPGVSPYRMVDRNGAPLLAPLLAARGNLLAAIAMYDSRPVSGD